LIHGTHILLIENNMFGSSRLLRLEGFRSNSCIIFVVGKVHYDNNNEKDPQ
jgi:hypothetical protein